MLIVRKSKNFGVSPAKNLKFDWKAALTFTQELWLVNTGINPPLFKISRLKIQELLKVQSCKLKKH